MKIITDKILKIGVTYRNVKFIRCLNLGAELTDCIWQNGVWKDGYWEGGFKQDGIQFNGIWYDDSWNGVII